MQHDDELIKMLESRAEVKIDGGSFIQNLILGEQPKPSPTVKNIKSQQMIDDLKKHGVEVSYIDPVTFEENKL